MSDVFFKRLECRTQTIETAILQVQSGEIWGKIPYGGFEPTVQAYAGKIRPNERGVQFQTEILPHRTGSPFEARWYLTKTAGVQHRQIGEVDYACISAIVENYQKSQSGGINLD